MDSIKKIRILGIRGVPAAHGGFETFAEYLALYLVKKGWEVTVYCQLQGDQSIYEDEWQGIKRVMIPVKSEGSAGSIVFDWKTISHAGKHNDLCLTLGYNTAIFCGYLRAKGVINIINMDGIEWKRQKWGGVAKTWFYFNDWAGCLLGNHLVADHPEIKEHLKSRVKEDKITMIPYGADLLSTVSDKPLHNYGLLPKSFATLIARAEPENSILEIVKGFSQKRRGIKLVVLGNYDTVNNEYHKAVKESASSEVVFLGAIYDKDALHSLRYHSLFYVHGHQVGGTNPSLVEAMGAKNVVIAHDNPFTHWVLGDGALYFNTASDFSNCVERLLGSGELRESMAARIEARFLNGFTWEEILSEYEGLLTKYIK